MKAFLLSDHNMSPQELEDVSVKLIGGEAISFDNASVAAITSTIPALSNATVLGVRKTSWIALGIAILIGVMLGACFVTIFSMLGW